MILPVFIELPAGEPPPIAAAALVDGCSASAGGRICRLAVSLREAESDVVVSVDFEDSQELLATIRLGLGPRAGENARAGGTARPGEKGDGRRGERTWVTRRLGFRTTDDRTERWRSVGLVIGALAADYTRQAERPRSAESSEPPRTAYAAGRREPIALDGGFAGGLALGGAPWLGGLYARASFVPWRAPLALTLSLRYERQLAGAPDFDLALGAGSAGVLGRLTFGVVGLAAHVEATRELVMLSASDDASGARETRGRWQTGVRAGVDLDLRVAPSFFALAGVDATLVGARTPIEVRNRAAGEIPSLSIGVVAGLRWAWERAW